MRFLGLDAGSVTVKLVVLDETGSTLERHYIRHYGHPLKASVKLLKDVMARYPGSSLSLTGSGAKMLAQSLGIRPVNEVVSQAYSIKKLYPQVNTIVELGGEDSKLILLDEGRIRDFSMNSVCAAGTGSFLEQQAERLKLTIEEFGEMAASAERPSKIAGRCSVFAKSDMIHLQQIATRVEDIVAGLCFAVARNFKGTIAKGREIMPLVAFQGGVAANRGMVRAFREVFELEELFVPPDFALTGALGAALKDRDEGLVNPVDSGQLDQILHRSRFSDQGYAPLVSADDDFLDRHAPREDALFTLPREGRKESGGNGGRPPRVRAYLGIDIGSISTNLAVIDEEGNLLAKRYLMTAGRPIEAVRQGLDEIVAEIGGAVEIEGVGTTGSGRYMIADYVGADVVKNEITAQATAALTIDPSVETIFEIGGQDSKYISLRDGAIVDFEMNKACAAGTGSFIEEQAEKLNVSVKEEFAEIALHAGSPCRLGERCTVFMENSLMANLQRGADKNNLLAGLAYSIVQNYINRVVAGKPVGSTVFFQGGVAFNKAVVAAFEKYLGRKVTVPPHHDVTGAIGMALIARSHMKEQPTLATRFKGFDVSRRPYDITSFECRSCPNVCEINKVKIEGEKGLLFYGGRCEKYDVRRGQKSSVPDLFAFREEALWREHLRRQSRASSGDSAGPRAKLGVPYLFFFHDTLPFWTTLLWELGFDVLVSPKTNKQVATLGLENVLSEACYPVKVAHGHIKHLQDAVVDALFIPSFIDMNQNGDEYERGVTCPHTQTIPYVSQAAISGLRVLSPVIDMTRGEQYLRDELHRVLKGYGIRKRAVEKALAVARSAQDRFRKEIEAEGQELLEELRHSGARRENPVIVIVGRGYNSFDSGVNLEIPKKLAHLEVLSLPMDFLPLEEERLETRWPNMYWRSGQRILKAARIISRTPDFYAVYIGNFSCGPDSFILKYFKEEMSGKPFLHIEIDEHSADAGAITRCEAFLDSIRQRRQSEGAAEAAQEKGFRRGAPLELRSRSSAVAAVRKRTIYIPRMADHVFAVQGAFEACGISAEVLPESDSQSVEIGRKHVSGKECYPYIVTAGDMLKKVFSPDFRPEESAFFMPSGTGPCRFGQYNVSHRLILEKLGLKDVPIFAPNQDENFYQELGMMDGDFSSKAWKGIIAMSLLQKCLHESRPYEVSQGDADNLHDVYRQRIHDAVRSGNGAMENLLGAMRKDFASLPLRRERRPMVGLIGEIFVRSHRFSNEDLIRKIEDLGGEVWLAPMEEWIYYVNAMSLRKALRKRDRSAIMNIFVKRVFQKRIEHKYVGFFRGALRTLEEPGTKEILRRAGTYVHDSFEGETVLSIGKAVDLIEHGASGIVNAMPFGCMPGTIVTALLKAVSDRHGVPCISIPYDGTESPAVQLQLEAFMEAIMTGARSGETEPVVPRTVGSWRPFARSRTPGEPGPI